MMKRLALVLIMLMLSSVVQARDRYEKETTLYCVWLDGRSESFILYDDYREFLDPSIKWIVLSIHQYPDTVRVRLEAPNRERIINFNNGWPCRLEESYTFTKHEAVQPESDSFDPVD